jgi:predicted nucleotidyltransferase
MLRAMPTAHREAILDLASRLRARFGPRVRELRLFGSWARGEASSDSDLDVAVVVAELSHDEWRAAISDAADVELAHDVVIGPYVVSTAHFDALVRRGRNLGRAILSEGITL